MKLQKIIAVVLALVCVLALAGCGNTKYQKAIETYRANDISYIAIRNDLTLVSNVYGEVDLVSLGLSKSAYFLYGDAEYIYFGVQNGKSQQKITVMEYSIANKTVRQCSEYAKAYRVMTPDGENFYYFIVDDNMFLGYTDYEWRVVKFAKDATTGEVVYEKDIDSYPEFATGDFYIQEYRATVSPYYWKGSGGARIGEDYISNGTDSYQPLKNESVDEIWSMIRSESTFSHFDPNRSGEAVLCLTYEKHLNYFQYTFGKGIEFIFAEKNPDHPITAMYILD